MSEKRNRRDLINEIIEKLQFELDPRARHYIKNFSVTMRLRPPEAVLAPTGDSGDVCGEVCSKVQCRGPYNNPPDCLKVDSTCPTQTCDQQTCTGHKCPVHSCRTVACSDLSAQVSHYGSLGNPDVQKNLKSKIEE